MNRQSGFTLIESAIALGIFTVVLSSVIFVQRTTSSSLTDTSATSYLQDKARGAVDVLSSELRWADASALLITTENGSARVDLRVPTGFSSGSPVWSTTITYRVEPSPLDADLDGVFDEGRLVRLQDGRSRTLCDYVAAGGFTATLTDGNVQLGLNLSKRDSTTSRSASANASTSVSVRN